MEVIIQILERKNLCLRNFHRLCEVFLDDISKNKSEGLEEFQRKRQGLVSVLEELEKESSKILENYNSNPELFESMATTDSKEKISRLIKTKDATIRSIVDLDLQILSHIDRLKNETIQKLNSLQSSRKTLAAYKSPLETIEKAENAGGVDREA